MNITPARYRILMFWLTYELDHGHAPSILEASRQLDRSPTTLYESIVTMVGLGLMETVAARHKSNRYAVSAKTKSRLISDGKCPLWGRVA